MSLFSRPDLSLVAISIFFQLLSEEVSTEIIAIVPFVVPLPSGISIDFVFAIVTFELSESNVASIEFIPLASDATTYK